MELARITAEQYSAMADFIYYSFEAGQMKSISFEDNDFTMDFTGYAEKGEARCTPREIVDMSVNVTTYSDEGDKIPNNFRADTLMAYVDEIVTGFYNIALTDRR